MKVIFIVAIIFAQIALGDATPEFSEFIKAFNKTYETKNEMMYRYDVFVKNLEMIAKHNAEGHSWTMGINEFADMTWNEFKTRLGFVQPTFKGIPRRSFDLSKVVSVPASIDWTQKGAVTGVKNQQQCGSCWAFSTTGSVEGAHFLKTGNLVSLSEQQLVDCATSTGNMGCDGGLMDWAFQYIINNNGITTEANYPYTAEDGTCNTKASSQIAATIASFVDVTPYSEDALQAAVSKQPVSVAIEADQEGFQFYSGGVFSGECGTNLDHGVLAVGYGADNGVNFWKIKNSWGASWGENGYIRMIRGTGSGKPGQCGLAMQPSYPVV